LGSLFRWFTWYFFLRWWCICLWWWVLMGIWRCLLLILLSRCMQLYGCHVLRLRGGLDPCNRHHRYCNKLLYCRGVRHVFLLVEGWWILVYGEGWLQGWVGIRCLLTIGGGGLPFSMGRRCWR
jgi:hypothetical protein